MCSAKHFISSVKPSKAVRLRYFTWHLLTRFILEARDCSFVGPKGSWVGVFAQTVVSAVLFLCFSCQEIVSWEDYCSTWLTSATLFHVSCTLIRGFPGMVIVAQLVQKFPAFLAARSLVAISKEPVTSPSPESVVPGPWPHTHNIHINIVMW